MTRGRWIGAVVLLIGLVAMGSWIEAKEKATASPKTDEQAMPALKRMADFIAQANRFTVTIEAGYDVVQASGQKVEFGETRKVTVSRPDRMRIDVERRDGGKGLFVFDGKDIAISSARDNVYSVAAKPGTLDDAIAYFTNDLQMRLPLAQLFRTDLPAVMANMIRALDYVEQATIGGVVCDHLAARTDEVDFQVWIARSGDPLPRRVVITYKQAEGQPQFWAQFSDWNFQPQIADAAFSFTPPQGAERIPFLVQVRGGTGQQQKGDNP
jgi:hypothetical protein